MARLEDYRQLFAYRYTGAIVTKAGHGPGGWTAYKRPLDWYQIALHLLADRVPGRRPIWYGSRSLPRSRYFCLDVDADRTPERILAKTCPDHDFMPEHTRAAKLREIADDLASRPAKPPQLERLTQVNRALRRMGINPDNPRSVLNLASPSGGRHIYVFFDRLYFLDQFHELLCYAGLRHVSGEIEFYPSRTHGLRLPFGSLPGQPHDPQAWIQFIDDFRNGQMIQHSLNERYENVTRHRSTQTRRIESLKKAAAELPGPAESLIIGQPKQVRLPQNSPTPQVTPVPPQRYLQLLDGVHSAADAREFLDLGILVDGTRTKTLKVLAAHLIWFKGFTAKDAAQSLTHWAMSPRHVSKDIEADLTKGTTVVADHISRMCRWYEAKKNVSDDPPTRAAHEFSPRELDALRPSLASLSGEDKANQAEFLLHFLRFAKRHGSASEDLTGWHAAPAVRQVIRRWPGCHHMNYKTRITHAISGGSMTVVKGAWHRSTGPGRARTYRLSVPVVPTEDCTLTYEAALDYLKGNSEPVSPVQASREESPHASHPDRADDGYANSCPAQRSCNGILPAPLRSTCPRTSLDSGPRQCHSQPNAAPGLHRRDPQELRTNHAVIADHFPAFPTLSPMTHPIPWGRHSLVWKHVLFIGNNNRPEEISRYSQTTITTESSLTFNNGRNDMSTAERIPEGAGNQEERDTYNLWNPCQETLDYWDLQEEAIERRFILQLKYSSKLNASLSALQDLRQKLMSSPQGKDPLESFADGFEDGSCFHFRSFLDEFALPFDPLYEAAAFITDRLLNREVNSKTKMVEEYQWAATAIAFFSSLYEFFGRLVKLFIAQNPDMLANAPERHRLAMMEWRTAYVIAQILPKWVDQKDDATVGNSAESSASN